MNRMTLILSLTVAAMAFSTGVIYPSIATAQEHTTRYYYLTADEVPAALAPTACSTDTYPAYHMASIFELLDPSGLTYAIRARNAYNANADQGSGPPSSAPGWVRTGASNNGPPNCNAYSGTTGLGAYGTLAYLESPSPPSITQTHSITQVWVTQIGYCSEAAHVWCIQGP
jgi:hypothetical protein